MWQKEKFKFIPLHRRRGEDTRGWGEKSYSTVCSIIYFKWSSNKLNIVVLPTVKSITSLLTPGDELTAHDGCTPRRTSESGAFPSWVRMGRKEETEKMKRGRRRSGRSPESGPWWGCCWGSRGARSRATGPAASDRCAPEWHAAGKHGNEGVNWGKWNNNNIFLLT